MVLLDSGGQIIAKVTGAGTNHLLLGMTETRRRIADMTSRAKKEAGIPEDVPLSAIVSNAIYFFLKFCFRKRFVGYTLHYI